MTTVYCKQNGDFHDFYIKAGNDEYYLFSQKKKNSVDQFYGMGVILDKAIHHGIGRSDWAIHHTMDKLIPYIKFIEHENGISLLRRTHKRISAA